MKRHSLSVVYPAFNEAENIGGSISRAIDYFDELDIDGEVIVVDDGSIDETSRVAGEWSERDSRVRLVCHPRNRGYGAALKSGIRASRMERIFFTDADLQFDLTELSQLLQWADSYDIIAGYRAKRQDPVGRRLNAWAWGRLVGVLFDLEVRDVDCAFKLFHRRVFEKIPIHSVGAFVNTEILVRARVAGFTLKQLPVTHYPRTAGTQTGADMKVIAKAFSELYRLRGDIKEPTDRALLES